ncbi:MAG TPA: adenosylcobinamide-phosphate synthase CbiB [Puia sp.]|nr:adenosylcobinamide-phosphate synthase CbiB [Puia sp.]
MERTAIYLIIPLVAGYLLDLVLGDPGNLPHPVRFFGLLITRGEAWLNKPAGATVQGVSNFLKGMGMTLFLCAATFLFFYGLLRMLWTFSFPLYLVVSSVFVAYGLANRQLILEGNRVFETLQNQGLEAGRQQLSRIVGRDTTRLSIQQVRIAVLETMSENLGDGVIAPLFYYLLAGVPGMMTYKMINTLDSMIGYRHQRYEQFGKFAARLDDVVNFIPARLTALLMVLVTASPRGARFILRYGHQHKSPNAGYPEAALAGILNTQFGGPNVYQGVLVEKPFIGNNNRVILPGEIKKVSAINHRSCLLMVLLVLIIILLKSYLP